MNVTVNRDGIRLRGILDKPDLEKCPIAILFHGFSGDLGYQEDDLFPIISTQLMKQGVSSIRFDFSGHGKSDGKFEEMDVLKEIEDAISILSFVRSLDFVTDIYIVGHSQGGVVGGMLAGYYAEIISRLVLLAPAATLKEDAKAGICMGTQYDTHHIPDVISIGDQDLQVGGQYFRIAKYLPIYEVTKEFKGPTLVIHGKKDSVVSINAAIGYQNALESCDVALLEDLDHAIEGMDQKNAIDKILRFLE